MSRPGRADVYTSLRDRDRPPQRVSVHDARHGRARPGLTDLAGTYAATLLVQGSTLVVGVVLARALGPEARGTLAAALIWPTMIAGLALRETYCRQIA